MDTRCLPVAPNGNPCPVDKVLPIGPTTKPNIFQSCAGNLKYPSRPPTTPDEPGAPPASRHGRPAVLRGTAALAAGGLLLVVLAPGVPAVLAGALLWGTGASLGFPVGMSAAADDPHGAAVRVSVVSSVGYTAFLAGPPLIGLLAEPERLGVLHALLVVLVALLVGTTVAGATLPPRPSGR